MFTFCFLLLLAFLPWQCQASKLCKFCPSNLKKYGTFGPSSKMNNFFVANGETCNSVYMKAISSQLDCDEVQKQYATICCDENYEGDPFPQKSTPSPSSQLESGIYPVCLICENGQVPLNKGAMVYSLFLGGSVSCMELYFRGLSGNILDRLCYPLQIYTRSICGCPERSIVLPFDGTEVQQSPCGDGEL